MTNHCPRSALLSIIGLCLLALLPATGFGAPLEGYRYRQQTASSSPAAGLKSHVSRFNQSLIPRLFFSLTFDSSRLLRKTLDRESLILQRRSPHE